MAGHFTPPPQYVTEATAQTNAPRTGEQDEKKVYVDCLGRGAECGVAAVRALYDYKASDTDEISLVAGQTYQLSPIGTKYGEGWWELVRPGDATTPSGSRTGIAPSNYLSVV
jgi:hypothetical protein